MSPAAWTVVAHVAGATAIGALDCVRLGRAGIALAAVPLFALLGLVAGAIVVGIERATRDRPWWLAALALATPALVVYIPVARSLFEGAYAQTLPLAGVAPFVLPAVLWLGTAVVIAGGRRLLRAEDLTTRALAVVTLALVIGGVIWAEKNILKTGYPTLHLGATLAVSVLAGIAIRVTYRRGVPALVGYALAPIVVVGALVAAIISLRDTEDRRALATFGDQSRDLVGLVRSIADLDDDGSSRWLGGGDCDDGDDKRYPGAVDRPGDGIDQDCDGVDAVPVVVAPAPPPDEAKHFRDTPAVVELLARTKGMNVLLVSIDALRADMIAPDAPNRDDFPTIVKLLAESVWFTRAFAPASGTDISLTTLLTGRFDPFQPVATTLPEALKASGRKTYAAIPNEVLRYAGETMIGRGVDRLVTVKTDGSTADVAEDVSAKATTTEGFRFLDDAADKPFFAWIHYFDVHESHQIKPPQSMRDAVKPGASEKATIYRALLRGIDDELGRVLAELRVRNLADKTIVVFMSDHGESLGEDPRLLATHGKVAYAPLVRIPIALRVPGLAAGQRTDLVSLVDLAPTLFDLLGVIPADMPIDGTSLVPALLDAPPALRPTGRALAIHEQDQWSVVEWPHQLLVRPADDLVELYDVEQDPAQQRDIAAAQPDIVARLKSRYSEFPQLVVDRTPAGRAARERLAKQRPRPGSR